MGFRKDAWATCWNVDAKSDTLTTIRLSTRRKIRDSDEYTQDFSGFVSFVGTANAKKAAALKEKDRIKLGDVEVTTKYDADKKITYTNFVCFNFEPQSSEHNDTPPESKDPLSGIDEGVDEDKQQLPF